MPITPTYPGVYVEEIPSGVHTILGVATSITAFIGRAPRGLPDRAETINSFGDFERLYGGLWSGSRLGYAVRDFFLNGGSQAVVVRIFEASFADEDARQTAQTAANDTATAAAGADAAAAAAAARTKANTYTTEPEKTAANTVATAAETAAAVQGATVNDVKNAAQAAAKGAALPDAAQFDAADLSLQAASPGAWGQNLRVAMDHAVSAATAQAMGVPTAGLFNLTLRDASPGGRTEVLRNLTVADSARRVDQVLASESSLARWRGDYSAPTLAKLPAYITAQDAFDAVDKTDPDAVKAAQAALDAAKKALQDPAWQAETDLAKAKKDLAEAKDQAAKDAANAAIKTAQTALQAAVQAMGGADGKALVKNSFTPANAQTDKKGLYALEQVDLFNLLCLPPYLSNDQDVDTSLVSEAAAYCERRRAFLIVDPPSGWIDKSTAKAGFTDPNQDNVGTRSSNAALYFPRVVQPDPLRDNRMDTFVPCGVVAGIMARTDAQRGVWKAPAGLNASLVGVPKLAVNLTDGENGELNPLGINCLRSLPAAGRVVWGARTLQGDDRLTSEWKYIPIRRLALFIEESLFRGTQWVVFEPNDEPLWAQIRMNVGAFMHNLFRQGAFQGQTPKDAYFVKCDRENNPQSTVDQGIVNILVGFAPLKPAEFVIIQIQQIANLPEA